MSTRSFQEHLVDWEALHDNVGKRLEEFPHLAKDHAALEPLLAEGRVLESEQDLRKAELREINLRRRELEKQGRAVRNRLAAALKGAFGPDSLRLLEFGLQPVQRSRRKLLSKAEKAELLARQAARAAAAAKAEAMAREAVDAKLLATVALPAGTL